MDSDDEFFTMGSGDEIDSDDEMDSSACAPKTPSFETLTADQIVELMNQYIEEVESIVEVSVFLLLMHRKCAQHK